MTLKFLQKTLFAVVVLLATLSAVTAQEMEGEIRYLMTHNWSKKMMSLDYLSQQQRDRMAYMWGSRSEWKAYANLYFTATQSKYEDSEESAEPEDEGYSWRKDAYTIRRDFEKNTVFDALTVLGKTYVIEDSLQCQDWKILNDMKEVAGHVCMNAFWEDTVKQQKVTVWFALDMPAQAGPERFCGLPGIILEADINDGALLISADRIQMKTLTNELDVPKKVKGKRITEAEYVEKIDAHLKEKRKAEEAWFWGLRY
ncbi:MAG: GLPGLI family protein [Saprospiraceae bacterium]|nr:GLPGLI family protein [Lewinellaceae bacterium]